MDAQSGEDSSDQPNQPRTLEALAPAQAARLVQLASSAYERRRDYANASRVVAMGLRLLHNAADRKALEDRQKQINTELARSQLNDSRAPGIRAELDQPNIVRPRLLPGDPVPDSAKPAFAEDRQ